MYIRALSLWMRLESTKNSKKWHLKLFVYVYKHILEKQFFQNITAEDGRRNQFFILHSPLKLKLCMQLPQERSVNSESNLTIDIINYWWTKWGWYIKFNLSSRNRLTDEQNSKLIKKFKLN